MEKAIRNDSRIFYITDVLWHAVYAAGVHSTRIVGGMFINEEEDRKNYGHH